MTDHRLFISYRRDDSVAITNKIAEVLMEEFTVKNVFFDTEKIGSGDKWPYRLRKAVHNAHLLIIVIGPSWAKRFSSSNLISRLLGRKKRIDYVQKEIEWMIRYQNPILPVLVDGAMMPNQSELPSSLSSICRIHACEVLNSGDDDGFFELIDCAKSSLKNLPDTYHNGAISCGSEIEPSNVGYTVGSWSCQIITPEGEVIDLKFDVSLEKILYGTFKNQTDGRKRKMNGYGGEFWNGKVGGIFLNAHVDGLGPMRFELPATMSQFEFKGNSSQIVGRTFSWINDTGYKTAVTLLRKDW